MNRPNTHILVVEDEKVFADLVRAIVTEEGAGRYNVTVAGSLTAAQRELQQTRFDLALLDLTLPDCKGLDSYRRLHQAAPLLPVIVLSGLVDEAVALESLRSGAQDYLLKNEFDGRLLGRAIRYALERKAVEVRLRESEEFFRLISENMSDLISVLDENGRRLYNSPSYHSVLGQPEQELAGTSSFAEIHPEDRDAIRGVFQEVVTTGKGRRAEYRFVRNDGTVRHVESQSNVIKDEIGRSRKVVVVSRDVTERRAAEKELRQALAEVKRSQEKLLATQRKLVQSEKLEAVSTFAAGVAHEVKNPLQTVVLGIDYLRDYVVKDDATASELLQQMSEAVMRADAIVRGLLEFSAYRKGSVSDQDLGHLVEQSLVNWEGELVNKGIKLRSDYAAALPRLRLDPRALKHVLISLFATEISRIPTGGELLVRTFLRAPSAGPNGRSFVVLEVESSAAISSKPVEATGTIEDFSLTVARKIIELYGGKFERRTRRGSGFSISFHL